ncbi:ABC transporter permease [bacterium]|jgi:putative ABC transport system permease protein|nr:ABC transporter permease [bacterium]
MGLPLDHSIRNLGRRPTRTLLAGLSSAMVAALLVATVAFARGLEGTFSGAADPRTALLLSSVADRDVVRSTAQAGLGSLVQASVPGILAASDEIHMGTTVLLPGDDTKYSGFVRGVTDEAYEVHQALTLTAGRLPGPGEVMVGRLVAGQTGLSPDQLGLGQAIILEGAELTIVGHFAAPGTTLEAEIWTPLEPLRGLSQREDSSCVFVLLDGDRTAKLLKLFCDRRLDLELEMVSSEEYYAELADYMRPIRSMAWALSLLIGLAALLGGANTAIASVQDRIRELAALRALGFSSWSIVRSLLVEAIIIAAAGALFGLALGRLVLSGASVSLAMSAFELRADAVAVLVAFGSALLIALLGVIPAALRVVRLPIAIALVED